MLYDFPRNFISDGHTSSLDDITDGEEVTLERGGVLVQVGERLSEWNTDLSELLKRRSGKDSQARIGISQVQSKTSQVATEVTGATLGTRPATLQTVPPFEQWQNAAAAQATLGDRWEQEISSKRRRRDDEHVPLFQILKNSRPSKLASARKPIMRFPEKGGNSKVATNAARKEGDTEQGRLNVKETIDLTSSSGMGEVRASVSDPVVDNVSTRLVENVAAPATNGWFKPPAALAAEGPNSPANNSETKSPRQETLVRQDTSLPKKFSNQTRHAFRAGETDATPTTRPNHPLNRPRKPIEPNNLSPPPPPPRSPPVSTSNHLPSQTNLPNLKSDEDDGFPRISQILSPPKPHQQAPPPREKLPTQPLRLAPRKDKKRLLCQGAVSNSEAEALPKLLQNHTSVDERRPGSDLTRRHASAEQEIEIIDVKHTAANERREQPETKAPRDGPPMDPLSNNPRRSLQNETLTHARLDAQLFSTNKLAKPSAHQPALRLQQNSKPTTTTDTASCTEDQHSVDTPKHTTSDSPTAQDPQRHETSDRDPRHDAPPMKAVSEGRCPRSGPDDHGRSMVHRGGRGGRAVLREGAGTVSAPREDAAAAVTSREAARAGIADTLGTEKGKAKQSEKEESRGGTCNGDAWTREAWDLFGAEGVPVAVRERGVLGSWGLGV